MKPLLDALLTTDPVQRVRLAQAGLALVLMATGVVAMHYFAAVGVAPVRPVALWSAVTLGGMLAFFVLIRSGLSRRWAEPSLTVPQILFALSSGAVAYTLLGAGRGAVFPVVMVVLMFGMFVVSPRQMRWLSVYAVLLFGSAMAVMSVTQPRLYPLVIEVGHFLLVATMMPAVSLLAGRLSRIRHRARQQRAELAQALARLRESATRDELTGLINRRHMLGLMAQEHQRCIRSGQSFCLALLDIDRFKPVNEAHGYAVGDTVLSALAQEAQRQVRVSDVLARWGGDKLLLMMSDTRAALARGGLERLQRRLEALRIVHGTATVGVTLSAGLAEHMAGEPMERTLERTAAALAEAKAQGSGRIVVSA
jgi:diguanylate cyclase (GGDEF)-like protein